MDDTISRAAALDALGERPVVWSDNDDYTLGERNQYDMDRLAIETVPSAQPFATDTNVGGNLIDRQAAISEIMEDIKDRSLHDDPATPEDYAEGYDEGIRNAAAIVLQMPSAQPEIIRCKDCKFWKKYGYINGKPEFLPKCGFNQIYTSKDDFCSRAER